MAHKIELTRDTTAPAPDTGGPLHFEGTVNLGGTVTGQMLSVLFGADADVSGKLRFDGSVQIDGTFRGAITTNDVLVVGQNAKIDAEITCGSAVVSGSVVGNITASESVSLESGARVKGDISTPTLGIEKGVVFDGVSRMGSTRTKRPGH